MLRNVLIFALFLQAPLLWAETIEPTMAAQPSDTRTDGVATATPLATTETLGEADHEALRALLAAATTALNNLDDASFTPLLADNFVLTLADQTVITSREQLNDYFRRYFKGDGAPLKGVTFSPVATVPTLFVDSRPGVVYGTSQDTYTLADGSTIVLDAHWTATVTKEGERWQVQSFHAGVNMLDNPILAAVRQGYVLWAVIGLVTGFVVGAVLSRAMRRR